MPSLKSWPQSQLWSWSVIWIKIMIIIWISDAFLLQLVATATFWSSTPPLSCASPPFCGWWSYIVIFPINQKWRRKKRPLFLQSVSHTRRDPLSGCWFSSPWQLVEQTYPSSGEMISYHCYILAARMYNFQPFLHQFGLALPGLHDWGTAGMMKIWESPLFHLCITTHRKKLAKLRT